jgi:hypothetical protein
MDILAEHDSPRKPDPLPFSGLPAQLLALAGDPP